MNALTADQRRTYEDLRSRSHGRVGGPTLLLLHEPGLAAGYGVLAEHIRVRLDLSDRLREIAILTTVSSLQCEYALEAHTHSGLQAGLSEEVVAAIRLGAVPSLDHGVDAIVHRFVKELTNAHRVSDETYGAALEALGSGRLVELSALVGFYSMVGAILNAHSFPAASHPEK